MYRWSMWLVPINGPLPRNYKTEISAVIVKWSLLLYSGWLQLDVLMHAKRRKVHADDNGAVVLLMNCTSFISIFEHLNDTRSVYNSISVLV